MGILSAGVDNVPLTAALLKAETEHGHYMVGSHRDISERKLMESYIHQVAFSKVCWVLAWAKDLLWHCCLLDRR